MLNCPMAVLHQPEYEALLMVAPLLDPDRAGRRTFGVSQLLTLRAELGAALAAINASRLLDAPIGALTLLL